MMFLLQATTTHTVGGPSTAYLPVMVFLFLPSRSGAAAHPRSLSAADKIWEGQDAPVRVRHRSGNRAHERFTVRYYIVAMLFLIFDVETIFLCPGQSSLWAGISRSRSSRLSRCLSSSHSSSRLLLRVAKGALEWA